MQKKPEVGTLRFMSRGVIVLTPNPDRLQGKTTKALLPEEDTEKVLNKVSAEQTTSPLEETLAESGQVILTTTTIRLADGCETEIASPSKQMKTM